MSQIIEAIESSGSRRYVYPTDIVAEAGASKSITSPEPARPTDSVEISHAAQSISQAVAAAPAASPITYVAPQPVETATTSHDVQGSPSSVGAWTSFVE